MMRFLCLTSVALLALPINVEAGKPVEIFVAGERYETLEAYKAAVFQKKRDALKQQQELAGDAKALGVDIDPKKIKTITIKPAISAQTATKLQLASADNGLQKLLVDFKQNSKKPNLQKFVSPQELEDKIRETVSSTKNPVLLISEQGKMRIMTLTPKDKQKITP